MVLAIDFDGVVHDYKHPIPGKSMGPPIKWAKEVLTALHETGHTIIIFTVWGADRWHVIDKWMKFYGIPFDHITNIKPEADWYIDDKAIKFMTWEQALEEISGTETKAG